MGILDTKTVRTVPHHCPPPAASLRGRHPSFREIKNEKRGELAQNITNIHEERSGRLLARPGPSKYLNREGCSGKKLEKSRS